MKTAPKGLNSSRLKLDQGITWMFLEAVRNRCSVRQFKPELIPDRVIRKILDAARWAPSPFNTQPWEFVIMMKISGKNKH